MSDPNLISPPSWATESLPLEDSKATGKDIAAEAKYENPHGIKIDPRTSGNSLLRFQNVEVVTPKAILLIILDEETGEFAEDWFPKSLLSNIDEAAGTVRVYTNFLEDKKEHLTWQS